MLPRHLAADMNAATWPQPKVPSRLNLKDKIGHEEFTRTLNIGLWMVIVVDQEKL